MANHVVQLLLEVCVEQRLVALPTPPEDVVLAPELLSYLQYNVGKGVSPPFCFTILKAIGSR